MATGTFPPLPEEWEPTRVTLQAYSRGITALPRALAPHHPKWWHASLIVRPSGLTSDIVPAPDGGAVEFRLDLPIGDASVRSSDGRESRISLAAGATGTEFADEVLALAADLGVAGDVDRSKFESDEPRHFDPEHASLFWPALTTAAAVLEAHRRSLQGPVGPLQLWPHGFDMAFEWFGTRTEMHEEGGETTEHPSQINFGFYPGGDAYFYANPWPFEESLLGESLPDGATWHTEGWQGTMLPYAEVVGHPDGVGRVSGYFQRVFEVASPTLLV
jgi:hypothetical protein